MQSEPATGYCSERCLMWDFFGVPRLKRDAFLKEMRGNQRGNPRTEEVRAYPGLLTCSQEQNMARVLAQLKFVCDEIRSDE